MREVEMSSGRGFETRQLHQKEVHETQDASLDKRPTEKI
jgi:hypothetical protein